MKENGEWTNYSKEIGIPNNYILEFLNKKVEYKQWRYAKFLEDNDVSDYAKFICESYSRNKNLVSMNMLDFFKMAVLSEVRVRIANNDHFKRISYLFSYTEFEKLYKNNEIVKEFKDDIAGLLKEYDLSYLILTWSIEAIDDVIPKNVLPKIKEFSLERTYEFRNYDFENMLFLSIYFGYEFYLMIDYNHSIGEWLRWWLSWIKFVEKEYVSKEIGMRNSFIISINSILAPHIKKLSEANIEKAKLNWINTLKHNEYRESICRNTVKMIWELLEKRKNEWFELRDKDLPTKEIDDYYELEISKLEAELSLWIVNRKLDKKHHLIKDIHEIIDWWDNATITIQTKDYTPTNMKAKIKRTIKDYNKVEKYIWEYWEISINKHKGRKVWVMWVKKVKY